MYFPGLLERLSASLEGEENGKTGIEREFTTYARLQRFDVLDKYNYEDHVQAHMPLDRKLGLTIRVRQTIDENDTRWVLCVKKKTKDALATKEAEIPISKDMFDLIKSCCDDVFYKRRYRIPHDKSGLFWEVDVFTKQDGQLSPWVKVDLETEEGDMEIQHYPPLPFSDVIDKAPADYTAEDKKVIDSCWNSEWKCQ